MNTEKSRGGSERQQGEQIQTGVDTGISNVRVGVCVCIFVYENKMCD